MNIRSLSLRNAALAAATLALLPHPRAGAQLTPGTRPPTESEQYSLQLTNQARASANGPRDPPALRDQ